MADRVLITGGTGKTGRIVAGLLHDRGTSVSVGTRHAVTAGERRLDWNDPASFAPALGGVTAVYLVAPTDRFDHLSAMRPFLEEAIRRGVERLVLQSASSLPEDGPMMGEVQAWLRAHAPRWVSLRPSWFMQNFTTQHLAGIMAEGCIYSATGDGRVAFIDVADIAAVAVEALTDPDFPNGEVILTGPETLGYDDVAAMIATAAGKPVRHCRLTAKELAARHAAHGLPEGYARLLAEMDTPIARGAEDRTTTAVERITGHAPRRFAAFLAAEAGTFTPR